MKSTLLVYNLAILPSWSLPNHEVNIASVQFGYFAKLIFMYLPCPFCQMAKMPTELCGYFSKLAVQFFFLSAETSVQGSDPPCSFLLFLSLWTWWLFEAWEESFQNGEEPDQVRQFVNQTVPDFFSTGSLLAESSLPSHFFSFVTWWLLRVVSKFKLASKLVFEHTQIYLISLSVILEKEVWSSSALCN